MDLNQFKPGNFVKYVILALVYFASASLGLKLAYLHSSATPVWPPSGIALAAILLLGYRMWPAVFVSAFLINLKINLSVPSLPLISSVLVAGMIALGNTLEAVVGAYLLKRFSNGSKVFSGMAGTIRFVAFCGVFSSAVSATIGVSSLSLGGFADWKRYAQIWSTWWLGDALSILIVAPLIIVWAQAPHRKWDLKEYIRGFLLLSIFTVVALAS